MVECDPTAVGIGYKELPFSSYFFQSNELSIRFISSCEVGEAEIVLGYSVLNTGIFEKILFLIRKLKYYFQVIE